MFNNIKKAVLSKRIKKSIGPASKIADEGLLIYLKFFNSMLEASRMLIDQAAPVIERNADKIAEAALILQPVFEELKETIEESVEKIYNMSETLEEDGEIKDRLDNIKECAQEIKQNMQEI